MTYKSYSIFSFCNTSNTSNNAKCVFQFIYLKIYKEAIKFPFTGSSVKVLATGIQNSTHKSNSEKVFRRVQ